MEFIISLAISGIIVFIPFFFWTGNIGFIISDEGYLWYGVQQTLKGQVPIRDFRSYDPGRYYWCAAWCLLLGESLFSIRICMKIFEWIVLALVHYYMQELFQSYIISTLSIFILSLWAGVIHKHIDNFLPLLSVLVFHYFFINLDTNSFLLLGIFIGLTFSVGLNHFLYNGLAALLAIIFSFSAIELELIYYLIFGGLIGLIPFLIFLLFPNVFKAYLNQKVFTVLKRKTTNLKLPIPFPWNNYPAQSFSRGIKKCLQWSFLFIPVYLFCSGLFLVVSSPDPIFQSCIIVSIPYMNHVYSRADRSHLISGIQPVLLSIFCLYYVNVYLFYPILLALFIATYHVVWKIEYQPIFSGEIFKNFTTLKFDNKNFYIAKSMANTIEAIRDTIKHGKNPVFLPTLAGIYAFFKLKSPVYNTFPVYPASTDEQKSMLEQLRNKKSSVFVIDNSPLDQREELRFQNTYPLVWNFIDQNYKKFELNKSKKGVVLFHNISVKKDTN